MHVGKRNRQSGEALMKKLPEEFKKKPFFTQISSLCTSKFFLLANTDQSAKNPAKQVTLKDLTTLSDSDVRYL
tara:strand:- start:280 stop:498 length:219 start_codon:yes stop_codon:yes gene_type:complete